MNNPEPAPAEHTLENVIKSLHSALTLASNASHEIDPPSTDEEAEYDRLVWLGTITHGVSALCAPKLRVLAALLNELAEVPEPGEFGEHGTAH